MIATFSSPRPRTLICGCSYHRLEQDLASGSARFTLVRFLAYTASPAFVVVSQGDKRLRCPRADLFESMGRDPVSSPEATSSDPPIHPLAQKLAAHGFTVL